MKKIILIGALSLTFSASSYAWVHGKYKTTDFWASSDSNNADNKLILSCNQDESSGIFLYENNEIYQVPKIKSHKTIDLLTAYSKGHEYTIIDTKGYPSSGNPHGYTGKDAAHIFSISSSFKVKTSDGKEYTFTPSDTKEIDFGFCY